MLVINLEPYGYSEKAKEIILSYAKYIESSWETVLNEPARFYAEAIIVRLQKFIGKDELDLFPNLTTVVSATTGLDHLDMDEIEKRNIRVVSLRKHKSFLETISSTAEHAFALMLSLVRYIPAANEDVKTGNWNRDAFRGVQLKSKTLGIIGMGRTGRKVAAYADAFGMRILYYDPYETVVRYEKVPTLEDLLSESDIISLHVHLSSETENMFDADMLSYLKKGCFIINTSRGSLIDEIALYKKLADKTIAGVATDVLACEMDGTKISPLWKAQQENFNVIITPHIGGATWDAMWACEEFLAGKINS